MAGEYDTAPLGEVASVRSGFAFKSSDWAENGIPVVKIANVKDGRLVMDGCSFVPQAVADSAAEFALQVGDILIAMTGYVGDVAIVRERDLPAALNQRVGRFAIRDRRRLDQRFLFYLLRDADVRQEIEGLGYGSAQPNVSPSLIHGVEVPLPPLPEQRAIAHILGTLDDKIELNRRMNETLEAMARALFKSWFVDFDPVRAKAEGRDPGLPCDFAALFPDRFQGSELGGVPEGWEVGRAGDLVLLGGEKLNPSQFPDEVFDHFSIPAYDEGRTPKAERGEDIKSAKSMVLAESVLLSRLNPRFPRVWLPSLAGRRRAICSTEFLVCVPGQPVTREYLYSLFTSQEFAAEFATFVTGTSGSHQRVKQESLLAMRVLQPPAPAVGAYTTMVAPLLAQIQESIDQSRTLAALRDTLLPKLVSGEIRVATDEVKVE